MNPKKRTLSESKQSVLNKDKLHNYDFHQNKQGKVRNEILNHIHNWNTYEEKKTDEKQKVTKFYKDLEQDHSFIQWIFPNFFDSMFNPDSYKLTIIERNKMIMDQEIMKFYVNNYKMFLKFLGIKWNVEKLELVNKDQFKKCLRINTHNQSRLRRVLASLSVLGQRDLAIQLLGFIQKEDNQLYGKQYYYYDSVQEEEHIQQQNLQIQQTGQLNQHQQQIQDKCQKQDLQQIQDKCQKQDIQIKQDLQQIQDKCQKQDVQIKQDLQQNQDKQLKQENSDNTNINQLNTKSTGIKESVIKSQKNEQEIIDNSHYIQRTQNQEKFSKKEEIQQKKEFNQVNQEQQFQEKIKEKPQQLNIINKSQLVKQSELKSVNGYYERTQFKYKFDEVKNFYVQRDLLDQPWVTIKLFSKEQVNTQLQ